MTTLPLYAQARTFPAASVFAHEHRELQPREISTLLTERLEITSEELEIIEMRYQQALALVNLQYLFAEGLLGCM
jgi:hypothetical protein